MDLNEIIDFNKLDGIQIMRAFNNEVQNRQNEINDIICEEPEVEEIIIEQKEFNTMISELPIEAREIIANILQRNFDLEEKLEDMQKNMDIAFKWFNEYNENLNKKLY